jgi:hypothetical protein
MVLMQRGTCRLCGRLADLVLSHVWPSFGYKRYVSNHAKGGQFVDLHKGRYNANRQYKEYWFCKFCDNEFLGGLEDYAATFCARLEKKRNEPHAYDGRLLPFLTSISWRVAMHDIGIGRMVADEKIRESMRDWKGLLNQHRAPAPGIHPRYWPHSQHLFVVFPVGVELHKAMGGQVYRDEGLVLSQVGPLFIVGLLDRRRLPLADLKVWEASEVSPSGGTITPVSQWHAGGNVSFPFVRLLARHERLLKRKALAAFMRTRPGGPTPP